MTSHHDAANAHRTAAAAIRAHQIAPTDDNEDAMIDASNAATQATEECDHISGEAIAASHEAADAMNNEDLDRAIAEHEEAADQHEAYATA